MKPSSSTHTDAHERKLEVESLLDEIVDPCSFAVGTPIGLVGMGIIEAIEVSGGDVAIRLLPTFPGCLYTGVFAGEIERRLEALEWLGRVELEIVADGSVWGEERMAPSARKQLERARETRRVRRAELLGR